MRLSAEHSEHRWISADEADQLFPADHWLGEAIRRAEMIRRLSSPELLAYYRTLGFEL